MTFAPPETLFNDIMDLIVSRPTPEEIIQYKVPEAINQRFEELREKNSREALATDEQAELERFLQINHLLIMLKAKARFKLAGDRS